MSLIIDNKRHIIVNDEIQVENLTKLEFQILAYLCKDPGRVYTRKEMFSDIWKDKTIAHDRTIDVHIVQLRKKIDKSLIKSIKGVGYKINLEKENVKHIL